LQCVNLIFVHLTILYTFKHIFKIFMKISIKLLFENTRGQIKDSKLVCVIENTLEVLLPTV
jgi:hypothetical protein